MFTSDMERHELNSTSFACHGNILALSDVTYKDLTGAANSSISQPKRLVRCSEWPCARALTPVG